MSDTPKPAPMQTPFEDVLNRTLSRIPSEIGRLIYLASTRDYNSGIYQHDGLASRFSAADASAALKQAHCVVFEELACFSLEELVGDLNRYIENSDEPRREFLHTWRTLEPYRVAIPLKADPTMAQLLLSNIRIALEVLRIRQKRAEARRSDAWQLPSPAQ